MANDDKIILTADEAISLLPDEGEYVHNYINNTTNMFIGCDYTRADAEKHIRAAVACEIGGEHCKRMKHGLVVWSSTNRVSFFATDPAKVEAMERAKEAV